MAKYYFILLSCGCSFSSAIPLPVGATRWCEKCGHCVTIEKCEEQTTQ